MLKITIINCDDKEVQYTWASKREFIDDIDSDNENIPMLDDVLIAVDTDDELRDLDGITVNDLYEECKRKEDLK